MKNIKLDRFFLVSFLWMTSATLFCNGQMINGNEKWDDRFAIPGVSGGTNPVVNAIVQDSSGNIYIGGAFSFVGAVPATNIAKWDGTTWQACGNGLYGAGTNVKSLVAIGDKIYAGGSFDSAGNIKSPGIAMWNGNAWDSLNSMGLPLPGSGALQVSCLKAYQGKLYAGGGFTMTSGTDTLYSIASYDIVSGTWSSLGAGMKYSSVVQLEIAGGDLYACGDFYTVDGKTINYLAKWTLSTSTWSPVITSATHQFGVSYVYVKSIYADGNSLYIGGSFETLNGVSANNIIKYDIATGIWSPLGIGLKSPYISVTSIVASGKDVICNNSYDQSAQHWNGTKWLKGGLYFDAHTGVAVNTLYLNNNKVYIGGTFVDCFIKDTIPQKNIDHFVSSGICGYDISTGHIFYQHIAKAHGLNASPFGSGVQRIARSGSDIYAVGGFTLADNKPVNGIARWDGTVWDTLGKGLSENGGGWEIAADANYVYVQGTGYNITFGNLPPVTGKNMGIWDIANKKWTTDTVIENLSAPFAIDSKGLLYGVTHNFSNTIFGIGYFDPVSGKLVSLGVVSSGTNVLAFDDSDNLFIGGKITSVGGVSVSGLAKWTSATKTWKGLGGGLVSAVNAGYPGNVVTIYVLGSKVYVGGGFIYSPSNPGLSLPGIGIFDQATGKWSQMPTITNNWKSVSAIAGNGKTIYAAGKITYQTFYTTDYIAQWDTSTKKWTSLGSGTGTVNTMLLNGNYLYAAGAGRSAGAKPSYDIFVLDTANNLPAAPTNLTLVSTHKKQVPGQYSLNWSDNSNNESGFGIERSSDGGTTWIPAGNTVANMPMYNDTGLNSVTVFSYRVYAFNGVGKSAYSNTVKTDGGSGIVPSTIKESQIQIFPNPSHGTINISWLGNQPEKGILNIVNEQGAVVYMDNLLLTPGNNTEVHLSDLPIGLYFVRLQTNGISVQQKLVIQ